MEPYFIRAKKMRGDLPKTFVYDDLPRIVREQAIKLYEVSFKTNADYQADIKKTHLILTYHLGTNYLFADYLDKEGDLYEFFRNSSDVDEALTVLEYLGQSFSKNFIEAINEKLLLAGVGYQFKGKEISRIEDKDFDENITQPCIGKLSKPGLEKAAIEYFKAYEHLRNKHYHDAVVSCTRSLEYLLQNRLGTKETELSKLLRQLLPQLEGPSGTLAKYVENYIKLIEGMNALRGQSSHAGNAVDFAYTMYFINQTAATILFIADVPLKSS